MVVVLDRLIIGCFWRRPSTWQVEREWEGERGGVKEREGVLLVKVVEGLMGCVYVCGGVALLSLGVALCLLLGYWCGVDSEARK